MNLHTEVIAGLKKNLLAFLEQDMSRWLSDPRNQELAGQLLRLLRQNRDGSPPLRPLDLFQASHLESDRIEHLAKEVKDDRLPNDSHVKTRTVCAALVQAAAARLALMAEMETDMSGLDAKTPEARTDQDKGFGVRFSREIDSQGKSRRGEKRP